MLRMTDEYKDAEIVRTRDEKQLVTLPILVDVGSIYDPSKSRYDHHQRGFFQTLSSKHKTKLSSAGLIYKHYGVDILKKLTKFDKESEIEILYNKVYESFVEALDGIDNGIPQYPTEVLPNYIINTDLSARVAKLNPSWNEKNVDINERFNQAIELTGKEFVSCVMGIAQSWMPARNIVKSAIEKRMQDDNSGQIVVLKEFTVWTRHLLDLETEMKIEKPLTYILFPDSASNKWRVQAIPVSSASFNSRLPLPEEWRGLRDDQLSQIAKIPKCIFVHASGFIGGNETFEGAMQMATKSLSLGASSMKTENTDKPTQ